MTRREFILASTALACAPFAAHAVSEVYRPGLHKELLEAGNTVLLKFWASWSGTCQTQEAILAELRTANPTFDQRIKYVWIDWDTYGPSRMAEQLRVERRSTLILLRGDDELGRLVADTRTRDIRKLLELALT